MAVVRVGDTRRAASRGLRSLASPTGLRGGGTELAWLAAHAALYPLGFRPGRPRHGRDPRRIDSCRRSSAACSCTTPRPPATPMLLVHGMVDNRSIFTLLRRSLRRCGFGQIRTVNYSVLTSDVRAPRRAGRTVEEVCARPVRAGARDRPLARRVVARYYVQRLGGDARVHTLVTLGTPHGGTRCGPAASRCGCAGSCGPDSRAGRRAGRPAPGCRTRFLAVWSDLDQLIVPQGARPDRPPRPGRANVLVRGVGHMSLPADGRRWPGVVRGRSRTSTRTARPRTSTAAPGRIDCA